MQILKRDDSLPESQGAPSNQFNFILQFLTKLQQTFSSKINVDLYKIKEESDGNSAEDGLQSKTLNDYNSNIIEDMSNDQFLKMFALMGQDVNVKQKTKFIFTQAEMKTEMDNLLIGLK